MRCDEGRAETPLDESGSRKDGSQDNVGDKRNELEDTPHDTLRIRKVGKMCGARRQLCTPSR